MDELEHVKKKQLKEPDWKGVTIKKIYICKRKLDGTQDEVKGREA